MATRSKKPTGNRLAEIIAYRRSQGGSITGSLSGGIKERLKEKFDPRQLLNQKGLMTALFPGLKTYGAKTSSVELNKSSVQSASFDEIKPILETISYNTQMTAKNTMVLPALHRDANVIRQNMVKLVKLKGGDARTKADMYFVKAKDREDKYERELKKLRGKESKVQKQKEDEEKKSKGIFGKIFSAIVSGLKLIVSSIVSLGKAIFGAFKFLAEIVVDTILGIGKFLLSSLLGVGKLLSPIISEFLEKFFNKIFLKTFVSGILGLVWNFFTGSAALLRFGLLLSPFLAGFGFMLSRETSKESNLYQDKYISPEKELELFSSTGSKLPTNEKMLEGVDLKRAKMLGIADENVQQKGLLKSSEGQPIQGIRELPEYEQDNLKYRFHPEIVEEFKEFKRQPYNLVIPGMNGLHDFLLTNKEAKEYGDKTRDYLLMLQKVNQLNREKMSVDITSPKFTDYQNRISAIRGEMDTLKFDMIRSASRFTSDQISDAGVSARYMRVFEDLLKGKEKKKFYDMFIDTGLRESGINTLIESIENESKSQFEKLKIEGKDKLTGLLSEGFNIGKSSLSDVRDIVQSKLEKYDAGSILEKSISNIKETGTFKQPIVINENKVNTPRVGSNPNLGSPSSAWNNDFIEKYFNDMMSNPLGPFRN